MFMNRSRSYTLSPGLDSIISTKPSDQRMNQLIHSAPMDRRHYSTPCYPPAQHFNYDNFTAVSSSAAPMSSFTQALVPEWNFDATTMLDFSSPPMPHRSLQENFTEIIEPQDYCPQVISMPDVDEYMTSNFLVSPTHSMDGLVSPTTLMPPTWHMESNPVSSSHTDSLARYGGMNQMSPGINISKLRSPSLSFAAHRGINVPLSISHVRNSRQLGHRISISDPQTTMKSPLPSAGGIHHRSRASIQSCSDQSSIISPNTTMSRSLSTASSATTASDPSYRPTYSRKTSAKSTRSLAPKSADAIDPTGAANMVRIKSSDGTSREVGVLPRKQAGASSRSHGLQKLTCDNCDEVPDGFRGEHELMRHYNLRHAPRRKAFICIEPLGQEGFLATVGCRSCKEGKLYGAYYNAAAHLRRVHFDPRPRGRKAKNSHERRGGKAGGNNPPMDILKANWIREVDVANTASSSQPQTDNDDEEEDEEQFADAQEAGTIRRTKQRGVSGASDSTGSSSSTGSDDEATLISTSLAEEEEEEEEVVPASSSTLLSYHGLPNVPYPALMSSRSCSTSSTSTTTAPIIPLGQLPLSSPTSTLAWQTSYPGVTAGWANADASNLLLPVMSPQFEGLDNGFGYLNQPHDAYLTGPWS